MSGRKMSPILIFLLSGSSLPKLVSNSKLSVIDLMRGMESVSHFRALFLLFFLSELFGSGENSVWLPHFNQKPFYSSGINYDGVRGYSFDGAVKRVFANYMEPCVLDYDCDRNETTLLHCELNVCKCSVGRLEPALGGIVVTSEWSPSLQRCEATLSSECNASGGGITCINGQECEQLPDRSTGIGCCGEGCSNGGKKAKVSFSLLFFELPLLLHYFA